MIVPRNQIPKIPDSLNTEQSAVEQMMTVLQMGHVVLRWLIGTSLMLLLLGSLVVLSLPFFHFLYRFSMKVMELTSQYIG